MQITAQLNNLRLSPRKVRLAARVLRGMDAMRAKYQLDHLVRRSSKPLSKLLDSAIANAYKNFGLPKDNLFIKDVIVNEGPKLKRWRPKGFGSASPIEKKTSHIKIILEEKVPGLKAKLQTANAKSQTMVQPETEKMAEIKEAKSVKEMLKPVFKKNLPAGGGRRGVFGGIKSLGKRFFRRKAI